MKIAKQILAVSLAAFTLFSCEKNPVEPVPDKPEKNKKVIKAQHKIEYKQFKKLQKQFYKGKNIKVKNIDKTQIDKK